MYVKGLKKGGKVRGREGVTEERETGESTRKTNALSCS